MNRDMEDKMRIMQVKSIEAAEKIQSIFHIVGVINLLVAIASAFYVFSHKNDYNKINNTLNNSVDTTITISCIAIILGGAVICLILYCIGDYLYYNLAVKAYTLEFVYNNSCCISDVNNTVTSFNNNMIEGMNIVHANQNKMVSQNEKYDKI